MNVLLITSDQHNKFVTGCEGDAVVQTPVLDQLAADGTRFTAAYTNNPICMPARATLATGHYGHTFGAIDNCSAYDGTTASWGHRLRAAGPMQSRLASCTSCVASTMVSMPPSAASQGRLRRRVSKPLERPEPP